MALSLAASQRCASPDALLRELSLAIWKSVTKVKRQETVSDTTALNGHQFSANKEVPSVPQDFSVLVKPGYILPMVLSLHFKEFIEGEEQGKHGEWLPHRSVFVLENELSGPSHRSTVLLTVVHRCVQLRVSSRQGGCVGTKPTFSPALRCDQCSKPAGWSEKQRVLS